MDFLASYWKLIVFVFVPLCILRYWWVNFHYRKPTAAFIALATALEKDDLVALEKVAPNQSKAYWEEIAAPFGNTCTFGKLLRQSPKVQAVIHFPFSSIDVLCSISNHLFIVQFVPSKSGFIVAVAFLKNSG